MGRTPTPRGLLLDHPVFPVATMGPKGVECDLEGTVAIRSLAQQDRRRAAVQLMAGVALAAEVDLWPGRAGLRGSRVRRSSAGLQVVFGAFPVPLTVVHARLGGGDAALEATRNAALDAVADVSGLAVEDLRPVGGLGFFLEGALRHLLASLERPVDRRIGRCLWAFQWDLPAPPDDGEIVFWKVMDPQLTRRLGGAMCAALQRKGRSVLLVHGGASLKADGSEDVMIMMGRHSEDVLAGVEGWVGRRGRTAVVIGEFPPGWDPPPPPLCRPGELGTALAVTGVSLDTALRVRQERVGRFDPWNESDRHALTEAACHLFEQPRVGNRKAASQAGDPIFRALSLQTEGLERSMLKALSGKDDGALIQRVADGSIVIDGERWRLPTVPRLRSDPLHARIAAELVEDDPRRLLHTALAGGDVEPLIEWARSELDHLRSEGVREVLGLIEAGTLGSRVDALRAESCLACLDLAGARRAIAAQEGSEGDPWRLWIDLEDHDDEWKAPNIDPEILLGQYPRIAAELAVHTLRVQRKTKVDFDRDAEILLEHAIERLGGDLVRWYSILREGIVRPEELIHLSRVEAMVGGSRRLAGLAAHKRALIQTSRGQWSEARAGLQTLVETVRSPGRLGRIFIDLANVTTDQTEEIACLLRAHRLLEAAGFRNRTRTIEFNLAMIDLERFRLDRAEQRLKSCVTDGDPLHTIGEGMMKVIQGDLDGLARIIDRLPHDAADPRVREEVHLLRGICTLFSGRFRQARMHLEAGGVECVAWLRLLNAAEGRDLGLAPQEDPWGIGVGVDLVESIRDTGDSPDPRAHGSVEVRSALAYAFADTVVPDDGWLGPEERGAVAESLSLAGMEGWAERLRGKGRADLEPLLQAVSRLVGGSSLQSPAQSEWDDICRGLGLSGLEVRSRDGDRKLWRWGDGEPSEAISSGRVRLIPLGGRPSSAGAWTLLERLVEEIAPSLLETSLDDSGDTMGIVGKSEPVNKLRKALRRFAPSGLTVLLAGETGVGKDLAATAIHTLSGRKGRFVTVNVAAVTGTLFEAELYGTVKGAFTGADRDRPGLTEDADGGTLFLDEIGDLDLSLQVKLLRFLDSGEVRRVGSGRTRKVDVRVVAASHRDLEAMVAEGTFRQDLYYRMGSAKIPIPPLRDRGGDVLLLRDLFAQRAARDRNLPVARWTRESDAALLAYRWPGNVRELSRAVEVALIEADGNVVEPEHLPSGIVRAKSSKIRRWEEAHRQLRVELIVSSLERNDGNRAATARELGLSRQTLLYHLKQLGLD